MRKKSLWTLLIFVLALAAVGLVAVNGAWERQASERADRHTGIPDLRGTWTGSGRAILPPLPPPFGDGTNPFVAEIESVVAEVTVQDGGFFFATIEFTALGATATQEVTAFISVDKRIRGVMGLQGQGVGVFDATWNGRTISGVALDLSDGSTSYLTMTRD